MVVYRDVFQPLAVFHKFKSFSLTFAFNVACSVILSQHPNLHKSYVQGWSGGAMVLGKLPVPRHPTIWITVGQGPSALAVVAGGGCLDIFTLIYPFSPLSPSLWETARYRLKYCLKGPLNPKKQPNQTYVNCFIDSSNCKGDASSVLMEYCI